MVKSVGEALLNIETRNTPVGDSIGSPKWQKGPDGRISPFGQKRMGSCVEGEGANDILRRLEGSEPRNELSFLRRYEKRAPEDGSYTLGDCQVSIKGNKNSGRAGCLAQKTFSQWAENYQKKDKENWPRGLTVHCNFRGWSNLLNRV